MKDYGQLNNKHSASSIPWEYARNKHLIFDLCGVLVYYKPLEVVKSYLYFGDLKSPSVFGVYEANMQLMQRAHENGYNIFILSNMSKESFTLLSKEIRIFNELKGVVLSGEVGVSKPDSKMYKLLLERYHLEPHDCLFIDDKEENVEAARALGIDGFVCVDEKMMEREFEEREILRGR